MKKIFIDNTEPSFRRNSVEGVTTEARGYSSKSHADNGSPVASNCNRRVRGHLYPELVELTQLVLNIWEKYDTSERDSLNSAVTQRSRVNNTYSQSKKFCDSCRKYYCRSRKEGKICEEFSPKKCKNCAKKGSCTLIGSGVCSFYRDIAKVKAAHKGIAGKSEEAILRSLANLELKLLTHSKKTKRKLAKAAREQYERALRNGSESTRIERISNTLTSLNKTAEGKKIRRIAGRKGSKTKLNWDEETRREVFENEERNRKISKSRKIFLKNNPEFKENMIRVFMNAPVYRRKANKPERNVIKLKIENLHFTGTGDYFVTIGDNWHKNPDFIVKDFPTQRRVTKVVEIFGGWGYYHTKEEVPEIKRLYKEKGIDCLVIDADMCYNESDLLKVKAKIEKFIKK